ncbi:MAG: hypothetical protein GXP49_01870 [Deltaproteobacteria bacterium]|nr:hypothetical protein [Deltaproteobacteria bacterium]
MGVERIYPDRDHEVSVQERTDYVGIGSEQERDASPGMATGGLASLRFLGTIAKTYLVLEGEGRMVVIDQHAAAERVTFSRLWNQHKSGGIAVQGLLIPLKIELTVAERQNLEELSMEMARLGFEVDRFGIDTLLVRSVPAILAKSDIQKLSRDVIDELSSFSTSEIESKAEEAVIAKMACHGSVRAGQELDLQEVQALLKDLEKTGLAGSCPHGRPVAVEIPLAEMEKWFERR